MPECVATSCACTWAGDARPDAAGTRVSEAVPQAEGDAAQAYETLMVPALFGQWAGTVADADLAEALIDRILAEAERVLEPYVRPNGTVEFDTSAHIVTGEKACAAAPASRPAS